MHKSITFNTTCVSIKYNLQMTITGKMFTQSKEYVPTLGISYVVKVK